MSTYYLAFIVGDLESVEQISPDGTLVRIWATRGKEDQGEFALATSIRLLNYFNNYFGIPYPLDKLDHIAVPDFAAGAMENWGAITYREAALLFDETSSSANTKQRIAEIIAHEMAHMWFGDLVTMEWWDDLWLNESFASWMGNKAVATLFPEWDMWTQFLLEDTNAGLVLDGLANSHPIEMPVSNPSEIGELFDAISYSKGASILRMLELFLGEEIFRAGVKTYLSTHQYANARTEDLWNGLTLASGRPVNKIMDTWIKQPGFPVLDIKEDNKTNLVVIDQKRFLYSHILGDEASGRWEIPLSLEETGSSKSLLISTTQTRISVTNPLELKLNSGHVGFFRTNYSPEQWEALKVSIAKKRLPPNDRLGIQNDAFALTKGGYLSPEIYLSLTKAYKHETHVSVWESIAINLKWIEKVIHGKSYFETFQSFCRDLFIETALSIGWDPSPGEKHLDSLLRSVLLSRLAAYGHSGTLNEGLTRYFRFLEDNSSLNPDLKDIVFGIATNQGSQLTFDQMLTIYGNSVQHEEKVRILRAMSMFSDKALLRKTLGISLNQDVVRNQDVVSLVTSIANNNLGLTMAWDFVKSNWPEFDRRYGDGGFAIMRLVSMTGNFISSRKADDVKAFFENNPTPSAARTIKQSIERINLNAAWLDRYDNDLQRWFSEYPNKA
jgi:puromycin-sensitive aminopeptidase